MMMMFVCIIIDRPTYNITLCSMFRYLPYPRIYSSSVYISVRPHAHTKYVYHPLCKCCLPIATVNRNLYYYSSERHVPHHCFIVKTMHHCTSVNTKHVCLKSNCLTIRTLHRYNIKRL